MHTKSGVQEYLAAIDEIKKHGGTIVCGGKVSCILPYLINCELQFKDLYRCVFCNCI